MIYICRLLSFQVFTGNTDCISIVYNTLPYSVIASKIRFVPKTWNNHASCRVDIFGCHVID